ncbi:hypothetical protein L249_8170 [Ophiocordyceps polyrhachis-furcata BCC 54312]|uniref:Uncharacterized protein n=1 Tax=Ophiocordyceps polyrhachis-furcata BCC 54312 TaxID=1330021 RepID=A0A367LH35_9HYPO|nr:hypothetical protein L249_8170 [Ophiocordyceps polyrhachis-furcata BCC 54312]
MKVKVICMLLTTSIFSMDGIHYVPLLFLYMSGELDVSALRPPLPLGRSIEIPMVGRNQDRIARIMLFLYRAFVNYSHWTVRPDVTGKQKRGKERDTYHSTQLLRLLKL